MTSICLKNPCQHIALCRKLAKAVSPDRHSLHLQRETEGRRYVEFEFASKAPNYIRHALASVTVANGNPMPFISISCWLEPTPVCKSDPRC